jgi:hypothetical protein
MATKVILVNLNEEVLAILRSLKESADHVIFSIRQVEDTLKEKGVAFVEQELCQTFNAFIDAHVIKFKYVLAEKGDIDTFFEYPPNMIAS